MSGLGGSAESETCYGITSVVATTEAAWAAAGDAFSALVGRGKVNNATSLNPKLGRWLLCGLLPSLPSSTSASPRASNCYQAFIDRLLFLSDLIFPQSATNSRPAWGSNDPSILAPTNRVFIIREIALDPPGLPRSRALET